MRIPQSIQDSLASGDIDAVEAEWLAAVEEEIAVDTFLAITRGLVRLGEAERVGTLLELLDDQLRERGLWSETPGPDPRGRQQVSAERPSLRDRSRHSARTLPGPRVGPERAAPRTGLGPGTAGDGQALGQGGPAPQPAGIPARRHRRDDGPGSRARRPGEHAAADLQGRPREGEGSRGRLPGRRQDAHPAAPGACAATEARRAGATGGDEAARAARVDAQELRPPADGGRSAGHRRRHHSRAPLVELVDQRPEAGPGPVVRRLPADLPLGRSDRRREFAVAGVRAGGPSRQDRPACDAQRTSHRT